MPTAPLISPLVVTVPVGATVVTEVKMHGMTHTYIGDVQFVLKDPAGVLYNISCRPGTGAFACDYGGDYTFIGACNGGLGLPASCTTSFPPGTYEQSFGNWTSGTNGINNTALYSIPAAAGTWTLYAYDWVATDVGTLTSWDLCFGTAPAPSTGLPALTSPSNGGASTNPATLMWTAASCATSYDVDVDGSVTTGVTGTSFAYSGAIASHTWRVRAENGTTPGPWTATWTFSFPPPPPVCSELATIFAGGLGGALGGQIFFDMTVINAAGINLGEVAVSTGEAGSFTLTVYKHATTWNGSQGSSASWTLLTSGSGVAAGLNLPSIADVTDVVIAPGTYGIALILDGAHGFDYTLGNGTNQNYSNADLSIATGAAQNTPWVAPPNNPRVFNGKLLYNCVGPAPVSFCTAGTSTNGCVPAISASAQPSVSFANACTISIANVEGAKSGILFYGISQTGFSPTIWAVGSTSLLCVKGPTQRMNVTNSGGTDGLCNGVLNQNWNAYQTANPSALGNPFVAGNKVYVQGWYRDPAAVKTTNLSNALELTMQN